MSIRLSHHDIELLALMPLSSGSRPAKSITDPNLARAFKRLGKKGLIDGGPGYYYVRWGLLSIGQCKRLEVARKTANPTPVTDTIPANNDIIAALNKASTADLYLVFKILLVSVELNVEPLTDAIADILERRQEARP